MGKTDPYIQKAYSDILKNKSFNKIAFFGFSQPDNFTNLFSANIKDFYDIKNKNWNINVFPYEVKNKYDLIVCTRVAYFCKKPAMLIESFDKILENNGKILIDWGLGDHWRFKEFKIGWLKNNEHENAYQSDNFLWSTIWHDLFLENSAFQLFSERVKSKGYVDVKKAIFEEVPVVLDLNSIKNKYKKIDISLQTYWPDAPQLYIILLLTK